MKWEYTQGNCTGAALISTLNEMGRYGWEVMTLSQTVVPNGTPVPDLWWTIIYKRRMMGDVSQLRDQMG